MNLLSWPSSMTLWSPEIEVIYSRSGAMQMCHCILGRLNETWLTQSMAFICMWLSKSFQCRYHTSILIFKYLVNYESNLCEISTFTWHFFWLSVIHSGLFGARELCIFCNFPSYFLFFESRIALLQSFVIMEFFTALNMLNIP